MICKFGHRTVATLALAFRRSSHSSRSHPQTLLDRILYQISVEDPHQCDADSNADPDSTYHPDADPDSNFYLMRIRIFI
jgi:hypothetical protein